MGQMPHHSMVLKDALWGTGSRVGSRSSESLFCLPRASLTCVVLLSEILPLLAW